MALSSPYGSTRVARWDPMTFDVCLILPTLLGAVHICLGEARGAEGTGYPRLEGGRRDRPPATWPPRGVGIGGAIGAIGAIGARSRCTGRDWQHWQEQPLTLGFARESHGAQRVATCPFCACAISLALPNHRNLGS
ncbi:hypothetical protein P280DRAFT_10075 [Massarina eburnea CBS 473.64]|uniref:Uncharacterized protein n=1 Tax=Massarina eburnea CBS 473.64 TaxID=1395130 RepID=A0A6A6SF02_9PLEO|nr:hypothetical protein P280DRAFT_10075 [Massarina eburnea CBS 473.64]